MATTSKIGLLFDYVTIKELVAPWASLFPVETYDFIASGDRDAVGALFYLTYDQRCPFIDLETVFALEIKYRVVFTNLILDKRDKNRLAEIIVEVENDKLLNFADYLARFIPGTNGSLC